MLWEILPQVILVIPNIETLHATIIRNPTYYYYHRNPTFYLGTLHPLGEYDNVHIWGPDWDFKWFMYSPRVQSTYIWGFPKIWGTVFLGS